MDGQQTSALATQFAQVKKLKEKKDKLQQELSQVKTELRESEELAGELLLASGLTKVSCDGRTWWTSEQLHVSVTKDQRDGILEAAGKEGLKDELTTVNTATLKAWLVERSKELEVPLSEAAEGTAFQGLVAGYVSRKLHSVRASQG